MILSDMIKDECQIVNRWESMSNLILYKGLGFGVYAFTKPIMSNIPVGYPHERDDVVYMGMTGKYHDGYFMDKKKGDRYWRQGDVHKRLNDHRKRLCSNNYKKDSGTYKIFHDTFGCSKELLKDVYVCVLIPKDGLIIPDNRVRSWLARMESALIDAYAINFGDVPLCNLSHKVNIGNDRVSENSYNQLKKRELEACSLLQHME